MITTIQYKNLYINWLIINGSLNITVNGIGAFICRPQIMMQAAQCSFRRCMKRYYRQSQPFLLGNLNFFSDQNSSSNRKHFDFSIDRSGLWNPNSVSYEKMAPIKDTHCSEPNDSAESLSDILSSMISIRGPLTVSDFMKMCLANPEFGYYMKRDVFGKTGDFTTSPEISQMFGELVAVWCVETWQKMGRPSALNVIELGPGRGTLQSDFLRAARNFPEFYEALTIHLVETSEALRKIQHQVIGCCESETSSTHCKSVPGGPNVHWHYALAEVPQNLPTLFIAQEFFDALPVHQFEFRDGKWLEVMVDMDHDWGKTNNEDSNRSTTEIMNTIKSHISSTENHHHNPSETSRENHHSSGNDRFKFILSPNTTPAAYAYLRHSSEVEEGKRLEICPVGLALAQDISKRIALNGGGALIIDYGHNHASANSLRGVRNHEFVSVLEEPGEVDLSIDVDFEALARIAKENSPELETYGPIGQGDFLQAMGIQYRVAALLEQASNDSEAESIYEAYERLVEPDQMGSIYKVMSIVSKDHGIPAGFHELNK